ncbi:formate dehydrogenase subunit gamma [Actinomycetospora sp. NBRC 106375]|uniref:NADH-quinone oxidoreductase subunit NuoE family protein n=1 Tax=Actinomycetospora sp. NBRC 106375 TaxID=3032207 RepID=UPI0024A03723|nr:NAD(P)H-dependent oxidoreductase subunit E [Actinomycetospora sp. NBRC 106375]GLZ50222.1 formate dehydrogenase subunit gamma [Actinomycetospora sp. NBRC 106375]
MSARRTDEPAGGLLRGIVERHRLARGPLLPILHDVQREAGWIDDRTIDLVADELNLSRAEVHGVASFYTDFRREPSGGTVVRVCRGEACQAVGGEEIHAALLAGGGGAVTVDQIFCFGNCALGPSVEVDGTLHGRVSVGDLPELITGPTGAAPDAA